MSACAEVEFPGLRSQPPRGLVWAPLAEVATRYARSLVADWQEQRDLSAWEMRIGEPFAKTGAELNARLPMPYFEVRIHPYKRKGR